MHSLSYVIPVAPMRLITLRRQRVAVCVLVITVLALVLSLHQKRHSEGAVLRMSDLLLSRDETFGEPYHQKTGRRHDVTNITARFAERHRRLREVCQREKLHVHQSVLSRASMPRLLFPTRWSPGAPTVLYCPVPRVATTYMRRAIAVANHIDPKATTWKERFNVREVTEGYDNALFFFFTREPYSRLLSAYINKLWVPNPEFWAALGGPVISSVRGDPSLAELACGSDVTFPELISYLIMSIFFERPLNNFLKPSYQHCQVCNLNYKYIGHLETFSEDASYILSVINLTMPSPYDLMEDNEDDDIDNYVYMAYFAISGDKGRCVSKHNVFLKIWRALQIRGLISTQLRFPLQSEGTQFLKRNEFRLLLENAHNKSKLIFRRQDGDFNDQSQHAFVGSREVSGPLRQRKMALASAWSLVPLRDRESIRSFFDKEFKLFGYNPSLQQVFSPSEELDKKLFDMNTI